MTKTFPDGRLKPFQGSAKNDLGPEGYKFPLHHIPKLGGGFTTAPYPRTRDLRRRQRPGYGLQKSKIQLVHVCKSIGVSKNLCSTGKLIIVSTKTIYHG